MAVTIREANAKDIPGILALYSVYITETTHTFEYVVPFILMPNFIGWEPQRPFIPA